LPGALTRWPGWMWRVAAAVLLLGAFVILQRQLPGDWPWLGADPEIVSALERSLEDQRRLAREHPEETAELRARFDETTRLLSRLRILELSRPALAARYRAFLWLLFGILLLGSGLLWLASRRRQEARLAGLGEALERLSRGEVDLRLEERGGDALGRVARMIERASQTAAADRRRVEQLEHLAAWQEGARRVAHEVRTPLTAALLDLARLEDRCAADPAARDDVARLRREMRAIQDYVERLASFARLPEPVLEAGDLTAFVIRFVDAFARAFPPATLEAAGLADAVPARFDADLLRQAVANLCRNAAEAAAGGEPTVSIACRTDDRGRPVLEVADDGPGVPVELRARLFQPYVSASPGRRGLGLGLAISRKILLDMGGELSLVDDGRPGARFRLVLSPPLSERTA
jgi:two-component system, NtrC family, nitrogen regulation sensor histidine kinase NtrY